MIFFYILKIFFTMLHLKIWNNSVYFQNIVVCNEPFRNFAKFTGKHLCQSLFFITKLRAASNFIKKETLAQLFCCEFGEICENIFFYRTPLVAASIASHVFQKYPENFAFQLFIILQ